MREVEAASLPCMWISTMNAIIFVGFKCSALAMPPPLFFHPSFPLFFFHYFFCFLSFSCKMTLKKNEILFNFLIHSKETGRESEGNIQECLY